jgi:hypothetical protein
LVNRRIAAGCEVAVSFSTLSRLRQGRSFAEAPLSVVRFERDRRKSAFPGGVRDGAIA